VLNSSHAHSHIFNVLFLQPPATLPTEQGTPNMLL